METNRLKQFLVVAKTQNLREAADILRLTHSALSKSMKAMQDELSLPPLFVRQGRGIRLSRAGIDFAMKCENFLPLLEAFRHTDRPHSNPLVLATFEVFSTYFFAAFAKDYASDQLITLSESTPGHIEMQVQEGKADIGITYEPIPTSGLDFLKVCSIKMMIAGIEKIFKDTPFEKLPFVIPNIPVSGSPTGARGLDGWDDARYPRNIRYRVDLLETGLALCREGLAVICVPEFVVSIHNQSVIQSRQLTHITGSPKNYIDRSVYIVKRKEDPESRSTKIISKALRQLCSLRVTKY